VKNTANRAEMRVFFFFLPFFRISLFSSSHHVKEKDECLAELVVFVLFLLSSLNRKGDQALFPFLFLFSVVEANAD